MRTAFQAACHEPGFPASCAHIFALTAGSFSWRLDEPPGASARKQRCWERLPGKQQLKEWSAQTQCSRNEGAERRGASSSLFPKPEHQGEASCPLPGVSEMYAFGIDVSKLVEKKDLMRKIWLQRLGLFHFYSLLGVIFRMITFLFCFPSSKAKCKGSYRTEYEYLIISWLCHHTALHTW